MPSIHKILSVGNLLCGIGLCVINIMALIGSFVTLQLLAVVVLIFLTCGGALLAVNALVLLNPFVQYFGFVQFPFGRGVGGGVRCVPLTLVTQG